MLLAASTHEGEDATVIEAARQLGEGWFTIIAPRHPERGGDIAALCAGQGLTARRAAAARRQAENDTLYIADTLGEMDSLFSVADIVFLGGSLKPLGGHNPVEPAAHGLPILTGPHVFKNAAEFSGLRTPVSSPTWLMRKTLHPAPEASPKTLCGEPELPQRRAIMLHETGKRSANRGRLMPRIDRDQYHTIMIRTPDHWNHRGPLAISLLPMTLVWRAAGMLRRLSARPYRSPLPVICVGNLTAGGTGKTPLVGWLADRLSENGKGHRRSLRWAMAETKTGPLWVDPEIHDAAACGDEPLMLADGRDVMVARERAAGKGDRCRWRA